MEKPESVADSVNLFSRPVIILPQEEVEINVEASNKGLRQ